MPDSARKFSSSAADLSSGDRAPRKVLAQPAKLCCPQTPPFQIFRSALCEQLCDGAGARVSLVRAPAGFGKSTLMRQTFEQLVQSGTPAAWMRMDLADNDSARLLHFLSRALDQLSPEAGEWDADSPGGAALDLLDRVESLRPPFALFLDDIEVLQNSVALAFVRQLAERLPPGGRLILGSRTQPDIGLARLRAMACASASRKPRASCSVNAAWRSIRKISPPSTRPPKAGRPHSGSRTWPWSSAGIRRDWLRGSLDPAHWWRTISARRFWRGSRKH